MRKAIAALIVVVLAAALGYAWYAKRQAAQAERQLGLDSTRVLSSVFQNARALKVATVGGAILAQGNDTSFGGLLVATRTTKLPFTVDYFLDFSKVGAGDYRWDAATRTMTVALPDVSVARPNIDATKAQVTQTGVFITREAALRLANAASGAVAARADEVAKRADNLQRARANAREAVAGMTAAPLQAAGLGGVRVVVRFPWEGVQSAQPMDRTRTVDQVLTNTAR